MKRSTRTTNLVQDVTSPGGGDQPAVELHAHGTVLTGDEAAAAWNKKVDQAQADNQKVLACMTALERRRFAVYLRTRVIPLRVMPIDCAGPATSIATPRERRERRTSRSSGQSPPDDPDPDDGSWALTWFDRAPVLWRLRAARCRLLEIREGVER